MVKDPYMIMIIFVLLAFSGIWLQGKVEFVRKISAAMYCIFGAMVLANIGILPTWSGAHEVIMTYVVPFSISMILMNARLSDLKVAAPAAIKAFIILSVVVVLGFAVGSLIFKPFIGSEIWKAAGVFIAGSVGGTVNNIVVGNTLGIDETMLSAVLTAAMVGFTLFLFFIFTAPSWMPKLGFKTAYQTLNKEEAKAFYQEYWKEKTITLDGMSTIISVAILLTAISFLLKQYLFDLPIEIYVTTLTLIVANITKVSAINGSEEIGSYGFHLFFASLGGLVSIEKLITTGPILLGMYLVAIVITVILLFIICKLFGINYEAICIASNAGIGGPTTAPVMAVAFGWKELVLTGVILGILGYAIGSYVGILGAYFIKILV
ncbi:DUF819 domain-containing protein [Brevibacillus panacihumi]|uniref:DUF819 family protein n=1 Tax=Brevibacillus panacihumi TaxID=497735 RepID=A0A3M8C9P1_9BACL|nr:DUF819 family protein [Brevibacillus panacihumi]RNB72422.1 DUF819 family protein [Brevibacillus panacihumi]